MSVLQFDARRPPTEPVKVRITKMLIAATITSRLAELAWERCMARPSAEATVYGQMQYAQGRADVLRETLDMLKAEGQS